jgi:hypothetical protein
MLWNRQQDGAPGDDSSHELRQGAGVVVEVLQHVERTDDVPLSVERQPSAVELQELRIGHPPSCDDEAGKRGLTTGEAHRWEGLVHSLEHEAGAASDLQHARRRRGMASHQPADERVPRTEPEVLRLELGKLRERRRLEAVPVVELRRQ